MRFFNFNNLSVENFGIFNLFFTESVEFLATSPPPPWQLPPLFCVHLAKIPTRELATPPLFCVIWKQGGGGGKLRGIPLIAFY